MLDFCHNAPPMRVGGVDWLVYLSLMGKINSRDKGARGERDLRQPFYDQFGIRIRRGQQYAGGVGSADVVRDDEVGSPIWPGVHPEVKRVEKLNVYDAIEQATEDGGGAVPVVFHKRNHREWLVVVPLARLRELVEKINANQHQAVRTNDHGCVQDRGV